MDDVNSIPLTIITTPLSFSYHSENSRQYTFGIFLAVLSSLFIGSSFILKKKGLINLTKYHGAIRAGSGGFGYLYEIQWWVGLAVMGLGELCNFAAYGFAPASVVTPLGALSVLVSALLAVRFLDERLDTLGIIGCLLTVFGSIIIIIHAPTETEVKSLYDYADKILTSEFALFSFCICLAIFCLITFYGPRLGSKYVHIYVLICSLFGAFTITACKGLAIGLKEFFSHRHTYSIWLTVACAIVIIVSIIIQMVYLNRALDIFATPIVTTVYYVLFTTCVLITSGILFHEWRLLTLVDIIACLIGFSITTCGVILINYFKTNTSFNDTKVKSSIDKSHLFDSCSNSQLLSVESSGPTPMVPTKQQHHASVKPYSDLQVDYSNMPLSTNAKNEQYLPLLLLEECDFNF